LLAPRQAVTERDLPFLVNIDNQKVRQYLKLSGLSEYFPTRAEDT
jgi:hypothetical protein